MSIPLVNNMTAGEWQSIQTDSRLSEAYRSDNSDLDKLEHAFADRIRNLCEQSSLSVPNKIVVTANLTEAVKIRETGELFIHPLTFAAANLDRNTMTTKQQEFYKGLENYINDTGALVRKYHNCLNDDNSLKIQLNQEQQELIAKHRAELKNNFEDYQFIIPAKELDEDITNFLKLHKAARYDTITNEMALIGSLALSTFNMFATKGFLSLFMSNSMSGTLAACSFLPSFFASYLITGIGRAILILNDKEVQSMIYKPWSERSFESQTFIVKGELRTNEAAPKY